MAVLYRHFNWKEGESGIIFGTPDAESVSWSLMRNKFAKKWETGDEIIYGTDYVTEYDTKEMGMADLLNIMTEMKTEEVKELLQQEEWLKEPFMMFLSNPFYNKEFREQMAEALAELKKTKSMASASSIMSSLSFFSGLI